jgi:TolB-like protein
LPAPFILSLVILLPMSPFSASAGIAPQQTGAVSLSQGIVDLAGELAKAIPQGRTMTIAVTDFPDRRKQVCGLGQFVAERLSTLLSRHPQCRLIERRRLDMVLGELKFSMSELVDPAKARKLGQMLGVQGLVVGTITDLGATIDVDARIIDIQTDVSLPGTSASVVKDEAVGRMAGECGSAVGQPARKEVSQAPLPPPSTVKPVVVDGIRFEVGSCQASGATVTCRVVVTNDSREDENVAIGLGRGQSRMIDGSGNEYECQQARFGTKEALVSAWGTPPPENTLVPGTPTNLLLTFSKVSPEATRVALLEVRGFIRNGRNFVAQLRNIPLTK